MPNTKSHPAVQSLLLAVFLYAIWWWPIDLHYVRALVAHPWLMTFDDCVLHFGWALAVVLAVQGLRRRAWSSRIPALAALYLAQESLGKLWVHYDKSLLEVGVEAVYYVAVQFPVGLAFDVSHGVQGMATLIVAGWFALVWIAVRALAIFSGRRIMAHLHNRPEPRNA